MTIKVVFLSSAVRLCLLGDFLPSDDLHGNGLEFRIQFVKVKHENLIISDKENDSKSADGEADTASQMSDSSSKEGSDGQPKKKKKKKDVSWADEKGLEFTSFFYFELDETERGM